MPFTRRHFLRNSITGSVASSALLTSVAANARDHSLPTLNDNAQSQLFSLNNKDFPFQHGVASGDPLMDRVIIWTRITATALDTSVPYRWLIASDDQLTNIVNQGSGYTSVKRDFTVKVDVDGLDAGQTYYYAFEALGQISDIGRTKTLPKGSVEHLRIAFTSCSNLTRGYFNVYQDIAKRSDLDLVLHLGDYIYEYGDVDHGLTTGRMHQPPRETKTLSDYRLRHQSYKADKDLQEVHRQHPFMVIWDDHEVANNAWQHEGKGGAGNHTPEEGDWQTRLSGAVRAYMEWMPIREQAHQGVYRQCRLGDLVDLSMLDTRLAGRDQQAETDEERDRIERTLLGETQEAWLQENLSQAQHDQVQWKLLGQQVMMAQFGLNDTPFNLDQWDGYPAARQRLLQHIADEQIDNLVVLTGDIHSSWALELHENPFDDMSNPLGVELVTPAVTSPGITNQTSADITAAGLEGLMPHLNFVDFYYRGYVLLDIKKERLQAEWWVVDTIESPRYVSDCLKALSIPAGKSRFDKAAQISAPKSSATPAPKFSAAFNDFRQWQPTPSSTLESAVASRR